MKILVMAVTGLVMTVSLIIFMITFEDRHPNRKMICIFLAIGCAMILTTDLLIELW